MRETLALQLHQLPPSDPSLLAALKDLARLTAQFPECDLAKQLRTIWTDQTPLHLQIERDADTLQNASLTSRSGRTKPLAHLLALSELLSTHEAPDNVALLLRLMQAAYYEGEYDIQADAASKSEKVLTSRFGADSFEVISCLEEASTAKAMAGRALKAVALQRRVCRFYDSIPNDVVDPIILASQHRYLAWFLTLAEDYSEALIEWDRAASIVATRVGSEHHLAIIADGGRALCLAELGELNDALSLSDGVLRRSEESSAISIDQRGNIELIRGVVLLKAGRSREALPLLERSWVNYHLATPPTYAWRRLLLHSLAKASRAEGDTEAEIKWLNMFEYRYSKP
jgi:hypothetical protein